MTLGQVPSFLFFYLSFTKHVSRLRPVLTPNTNRAPEHIGRINTALDGQEARIIGAPVGFRKVRLVYVALYLISFNDQKQRSRT